MAQYFVVKNFTAPTGVWTPITVPIECAKIVIENTSSSVALVARTDQNDSDTAKTIPAGIELTIESHVATFLYGSTVVWVNPVSGTTQVTVSYTR